MSLLIRAIVALASQLLVTSVSFAQETNVTPTPLVEVSGGYLLARDMSEEATLPGWYFSFAVNRSPRFGIVGEVAASYLTAQRVRSWDERLQLYSVLGGPRLSFRAGRRVVPFGQILGGWVHARSTVLIAGEVVDTYAGTHGLAVQPGGGMTIRLSDKVGLRVAGDARILLEGWMTSTSFRSVAGLTFAWGRLR
jgi:hypothetical protein